MQQHTHPAWVPILLTMPLALRTHVAGTTVGDAGLVDHAQAAILLPTVLLGKESLACRATDSPIWLERKVLARVAPGFPGSPDDGRLIALCRRLLCLRRVESRCERGGAQRLRFEHMPQFQTQVRGPIGRSPGSHTGRLRTIRLCSPLLELIGRQRQTCLDERMIEQGVLFAARDKGKVGQVREYGSGAILPVKPQQNVFLWEVMCCEVVINDLERLSQFLPVATIAPVAKTPEPTFRCERD